MNNKQTSLIEKNDKGIISDTVLRNQLDLIESKLTEAHASLYKLPDKKEDIGELMDEATEYLLNPSNAWKKATFKQKVELQWFEFPKGVVLKDNKLRTTQIASIFKVKDIISPCLSPVVPKEGLEPS